MEKIIIEGTVGLGGENQICIDNEFLRDILIEKLEKLFDISIDFYKDKLYIENAYVSLFVANKEMSFDEMKESKVFSDLGLSFDVSFEGWSEWTVDYLYIEDLTIGNHDLLNILYGLKGKYIILTIESINKNKLEEENRYER